MKQPNVNSVIIDRAGTKTLRAKLKKTKNVKITINVDADSIGAISKHRGKNWPAYYRITGRILNTKFDDNAVARLERVERELKKLKRQIAA